MTLKVTVAIALPERQECVELEVPAGTTLGDAVAASGILARFPGLDAAALETGIWSRPRPASTRLRDGDRVELYRPLKADAKAERRKRAGLRTSSPRSRSGR